MLTQAGPNGSAAVCDGPGCRPPPRDRARVRATSATLGAQRRVGRGAVLPQQGDRPESTQLGIRGHRHQTKWVGRSFVANHLRCRRFDNTRQRRAIDAASCALETRVASSVPRWHPRAPSARLGPACVSIRFTRSTPAASPISLSTPGIATLASSDSSSRRLALAERRAALPGAAGLVDLGQLFGAPGSAGFPVQQGYSRIMEIGSSNGS